MVFVEEVEWKIFLSLRVAEVEELTAQDITWPDTALVAEIPALCLLVDCSYAFRPYTKQSLVVNTQTDHRGARGGFDDRVSLSLPWKTAFAGSAARKVFHLWT